MNNVINNLDVMNADSGYAGRGAPGDFESFDRYVIGVYIDAQLGRGGDDLGTAGHLRAQRDAILVDDYALVVGAGADNDLVAGLEVGPHRLGDRAPRRACAAITRIVSGRRNVVDGHSHVPFLFARQRFEQSLHLYFRR